MGWRLVCNQQPDLLGMASQQLETDQSAQAGAKHVRRLGGERGEHAVGVVSRGLDGDNRRVARIVERTARVTTSIVGSDCVVGLEAIGERA